MKRKSQSPNKLQRRKAQIKNLPCNLCKNTFNSALSIGNSLFRKYNTSQINYYYLSIFTRQSQKTGNIKSVENDQTEEHLQKYYKSMNRKHVFPKVKEVYKMHKQIPKILHAIIKQILQKCYHRKRLLQYFKIAKILGIKIESVKLSTFLLSANQTKKQQLPYEKIISRISTIDFSQEFQKQLLRELNLGSMEDKQNIQIYNTNAQNLKFKKK